MSGIGISKGSSGSSFNFGGTLGSVAGDLFAGFGDLAEAGGYNTAAQYAGQEAQFAAMSTAIQEAQAQREITQVIGAEKADTGAAGGRMMGSAKALLASSVQQGALQKGLIQIQGTINETGYLAQQAADKAMAQAATSSAAGSFLGGAIGAIASFF